MQKIISKNKDAFFNFELSDKVEAGISLKGWEVKSLRAGNGNLKGAFCSFKDGELYISNLHISQYMNVVGDETRPRKLLLHKSQLKKIKKYTETKGIAIVPVTIGWSSKGLVKVNIAIGKGKNKRDKRETIKKRDAERQVKKYY